VSIGQEGLAPNPISWSHEFEGGRVFYTGMGHTPESYSEDFFLRHVEGGLKWALRQEN
jgi:type 1 glutamine amidotransferase